LLKKPLITFKVKDTSRTLIETVKLIEKISVGVGCFDELENAIERLILNPELFAKERQEVCEILFDKPDGYSGKRAAERISQLTIDS